jgi:hypothetical protein
MAVFETEIRKLRQEMKDQHRELIKLIATRVLIGNWVKQDVACALINVKPRRMRDLRIHTDANGKVVGVIKWRKGKGKTVEYWKADLEAYLNATTIS